MRHAWTLAALAAGGLLAAGAAAPGALAADGCPNAAVRAQQNATHLPNCLAYERVSPAEKNGATPNLEAVREDGDRVLFSMNSGVEDAQSFLLGKYRATRTAAGWATNALSPPLNRRYPRMNDSTDQVGWSKDLSRVVLSTSYPLNVNDTYESGGFGAASSDVYLREADGSFRWIVPNPSAVDASADPVTFVGASSDLDRIAIATSRDLLGRGAGWTSTGHVFVWTPNGTHLATVLPDGSLPTDLPEISGTNTPARYVSEDGRRIAFTTGMFSAARMYVRYDADDPARAVTREVAVGPNGEHCDEAYMAGMSADGTKLMFGCSNSIVAGAPANSTYIRDLDGGPSAVRSLGMIGGSNQPRIVRAAPDYSWFYASGTGGGDASNSIYLGGYDRPVEVAVRPQGGTALSARNVHVSPNGQYLVFDSPGEFGANRGTSNSIQVYRYARATGEVLCVSCRADGSPSTGDAQTDSPAGYAISAVSAQNVVSDAGSLIFVAASGLDARDTNGMNDAYAWIDGRQVLLSDGRVGEHSTSFGATPDGQSFFIGTPAAMVADDVDGDGYDIFQVRPGGGSLVAKAPAGCPSDCQGPGPERPGAPRVGSVDFLGGGNVLDDAATPAKRVALSVSAATKLSGTRVKVRVKVSGAGVIRVSGRGLRQATVKAKKAGTYAVTVRLSAYGVTQQRKRGRLTTRATVRFAPTSGGSVRAGRSLSVTVATKKGGR